MSEINDGGSAFPEIMTGFDEVKHEYNGDTYSHGGMSLRDYFAAKAMQALVSQSFNYLNEESRKKFLGLAPSASYEIADKMLKARK